MTAEICSSELRGIVARGGETGTSTASDGKPIGIMPAILLVPTSLSAMATQLYKSVEMRDTTSTTKYPVANPHQGKFRAEVKAYLTTSLPTGFRILFLEMAVQDHCYWKNGRQTDMPATYWQMKAL